MRRGFALLATLWVVVGLSALALAGLLTARDAVTLAQNRVTMLRGRWRAEDCVERARAVIDDALSDGQAMPRPVAGGWEVLDRVVSASPAIATADCSVTLVPAGLAVNVNTADAEQLGTLLRGIGIPEAQADSMVDALLDWRDADDIPRALGAEADWYRAAGLFPPRNGPLSDLRELRRVRGFDTAVLPDSILYAVFAIEPGRIVWERAPLAVLATVPGVGDEALVRIAESRSLGTGYRSARDLSSALSSVAQAQFNARWTDIQRLTTDRPDAWILTARAVGATVEVRLTSAGSRAAIVRKRTTP